MNPLPFIDQTEFFKNASKITKERVSDICTPKTVKKHEMLFLEHQKAASVYLNCTALVQLYKTDFVGKPIVVRIVKPGELFGEVILFEQDTYPVNAVVLKSGVLYLLPKQQFLSLLQDERFRNTFIGDLMKKQRYLAEKIQYLTAYDAEQRFFLFLREHYGTKEEITVHVSKKNIAESIGTSPETFSRLLLRLKKDKIVEWNKNTVIIRKGFWSSWDDTLE